MKRVISVLIVSALLLAALPFGGLLSAASAAEPVESVDENGETKACADYRLLNTESFEYVPGVLPEGDRSGENEQCPDGSHDWGEGTITKEPTCSEEGIRHFVCSVCNAEKDEPVGVDPENHAEYGTEIENAVNAVCYRDGYTGDKVCARCRKVLSTGETIPKETVPHAWDKGTVTLKPTCQTTGTVIFRCTVKSCGASKEETLKVDPDAHVFRVTVTEPTCTEGGYTTHACTLCRYGYSDCETKPLGHIYAIRITPPTCTEGGITTYTCTRCRDSFTKDPTPALDHEDNDGDGYCDYGCGTRIESPEGDEELCDWCGEPHTGLQGRIVGFFHSVIYFFAHLFGLR